MLGTTNIHIQPVATNLFRTNIYIRKEEQKPFLLYSKAFKMKELLSVYALC